MVSNSGAQVSSESLINLQGELNKLSGELNELYELLGQDISRLSEYWRDSKFDEFLQEFHSSREKIEELSEKYHEWANGYLPPRIEIIQKAEGANMSIDSVPAATGVSGGASRDGMSKEERIAAFKRGAKKAEEMANEKNKIDPKILKKIFDDKSERGARERDIHADYRAAAAAQKEKEERERAKLEFLQRMANNRNK